MKGLSALLGLLVVALLFAAPAHAGKHGTAPIDFGYNEPVASELPSLKQARFAEAAAIRQMHAAERERLAAERTFIQVRSRHAEVAAEWRKARAGYVKAEQQRQAAIAVEDRARETLKQAERSRKGVSAARRDLQQKIAAREKASAAARIWGSQLKKRTDLLKVADYVLTTQRTAFNVKSYVAAVAAAKRRDAAVTVYRENQRNSHYLAWRLNAARASGATVIRYNISWATVERTRGGAYDFAYFDRVYRETLQAGMRPLIMLVGAPCWAHPSLPCNGEFRATRPDPKFLPRWRAFTKAVAARYPRARGIEIWNEANAEAFWGTTPSPKAYADLLRAAGAGINSVRPKMPIAIGGPTPAGGADWAGWLKGVYDNGGQRVTDALSLHPYSNNAGVADSLEQVERAKSLLDSQDPTARLWVTEVGVASTPYFNGPRAVSPAVQADRSVALYKGMQALGVKMILFHRLSTPNPLTDMDWENGLGLFYLSGTPKPAYCHLAWLHSRTPLTCPTR